MNERALLQEINADSQQSPSGRVIYLEGVTDVPMLAGLLGVAPPADGIIAGTLVRGLKETTGSGATAVGQRVEVARRNGFSDVFGVIDGDGVALEELAARFDPPSAGPVFSWKAYCIENLLTRTGWPSGWSSSPDWNAALMSYRGYVAMNGVHRQIQRVLSLVGLRSFAQPRLGEPLRAAEDIEAQLATEGEALGVPSVVERFRRELFRFDEAIGAGLDSAHALVNGKWLVDVLAPERTGRAPSACRDEWTRHAVSVGGLPEIRDWWSRVIGVSP